MACAIALLLGGLPGLPVASAAPAGPAAQIPFAQAVQDLRSPDAETRLRTVRLLTDAAYLEAAVPLAGSVTDPDDRVQLAAIAAELNIFMADTVVTRRRVGGVVDLRAPIAAAAAFASGPLAVGARRVPTGVFDALRAASRDDNPRVRVEAVYAFGVLGAGPAGTGRRDLLRASGPDLAAMIGSVDPAQRIAAVRVIGRVFAPRPGDEPIDPTLGDAVITALNDREAAVRVAAMDALGALRDARAVQALTDLFRDNGTGERAVAAFGALAHIAHPSSVPLFTAALADRDPSLRRLAVEGLARIGDTAQWAAIDGALRAERDRAVQLAGRFAEARLAGGSVDPLVEALASPKLREQARGYLSELAAAGRAAVIAERLGDPDPAVRMALVNAFALSDQPEVAPLLRPLAADPDAAVAKAVERALARLQ